MYGHSVQAIGREPAADCRKRQLMSHVDIRRSAGRIQVSPDAIVGIASAVVLECYGVVGIAARRLKRGRAQVLDEDSYERGIAVKIEDGTIIVDVYVVVEYGTRISEVAHNIIARVGSAVHLSLGETPVHVNVNVQGLRISG